MFRGKIIDRYIQRELIPPFFLSIVVLTLALFLQKMFRLVEFIIAKGSSLAAAGKLLLYILPAFLVFTIPMSLLVAALTAFSRLSSDSEVTAMRASRISLYAMVRPVMTVAVALFLVTGALVHFIAPYANFNFKAHLFNMVRSRALIGLEQGVFSSTFDGMVIYIDRMTSPEDMGGVFISDERSAVEPYVITARNGRLIASPESFSVTFAMEHGTVHLPPRPEGGYSLISFDAGKINLDINRAALRGGSDKRGVDEIDSLDLYEALRKARRAGEPAAAAEIELHKRLSVSYACLVFGLVGAPLGIRRARSGRSAGIAIAIFVILVYYIIVGTGANLAQTGKLSPLAAYWVPNGIITALAVSLVILKGSELHFSAAHRAGAAIRRLLAGLRRPRTP
jgi:lipopolysaccharide export system permease protein